MINKEFKFDFYLSEMSVSDMHGGGLTVQRILGDDLDKIRLFAHVSRFATDMPVINKYSNRSVNLNVFWESNMVRRFIGATMTARLSRMDYMLKKRASISAMQLNSKLVQTTVPVHGLVCPQGINSIYTLECLKKLRPVTYITWVMDDHLVKWVNGKWQYPSLQIEIAFGKHLKEASHIFVISEIMQAFYKEKFGVASTVLFGSSDFLISNKVVKPHTGGRLKFGYFGAVAAWQIDAIKVLGNVLCNLDAELDIYSGIPQLPDDLIMERINFKGRLAADQVQPTMLTYDALLLPISFKSGLRYMSEFNIATKLSECLASGIPTIAVGPEYAAMIKFLKQYHAAIIITSQNVDMATKAMELLQDTEQISSILKNARHLVSHQTGTNKMREKWLTLSERNLSNP